MRALNRDPASEAAQTTLRMRRLMVPLRSPMAQTTDSLETEDMLSLPEPEPERRGFERHDVWEADINVQVFAEESPVAERGRVRNMSINGMWVDTAHALPFKTTVQAEWCIEGGLSKRFFGRVVRSTSAGMAIQLETSDPTWRFRQKFVDLATDSTASLLTMTVQADRYVDLEAIQAGPNAEELATLYDKWLEIEKDLGDEENHQAFIHACLQARRLEYALERYRELRMLRPGLPSIERHLKQIGTLLAFCTLKQDGSGEKDAPWWKKPVFAAIAIVVFAAGATFIAQRFAAMEHERAGVVKDLRALEAPRNSGRTPD